MAEMMRPVARDDRGPYVTFTGTRLRGPVLEGLNVGDQVEIVSEPDDSPFGLAVSVVTIEGLTPLQPDGEGGGGDANTDGDGHTDDTDSDGAGSGEDATTQQPSNDGADDVNADGDGFSGDDGCDDIPFSASFEVGAKVNPGDFTEGSPHRQLVHTRTAPLTVPLSEDAMHALEGELAEANIALLDEEEEAAKLAEALKVRKASIKALKADVDQLTRDRRAGTREIETEVEVWSAFDLKPPQRVTIRTDTMEIVALSPIEDSDRQVKIPAKAPTLAETLGEPKTGPTLTVIVGGKEEWEGDEIPGTDEDAHEPPVGDVGETGYGDEIPF